MPGAAKKPSRKKLVEEYLERHKPSEINAETLAGMRRFVIDALGGEAKISQRYLLDLAEAAGTPVARELGGQPADLRGRVHFHDFAAAESSLRDLAQEYANARAAGDRQRAEDCRRAVLRGRQRLEFLLRRPGLSPEKRAEKEEILAWFRVWLETPELFHDWLELRKKARIQEPC